MNIVYLSSYYVLLCMVVYLFIIQYKVTPYERNKKQRRLIMKCYTKEVPLTDAEKRRILSEAERNGPLSETDRERVIREAELRRGHGHCSSSMDDKDFMTKLLTFLGILGSLGLLYWLFMYNRTGHVQKVAPETTVIATREPARSVEVKAPVVEGVKK